MILRTSFLVLSVGSIAACAVTADPILGQDGKALLGMKDVVPVRAPCDSGAHPNVCCRGEACYMWVDDPFRPCEFGFTAIGDGSRCCAPGNKHCDQPTPPPPPYPYPPYPYPPYPPPPSQPPHPSTCASPTDVLDCSEGYGVSSFRSASGGPEVHVIGVYETNQPYVYDPNMTWPPPHPRGTATVRVERTGEQVLVLSAYEPTDFTVTAVPGAQIKSIILNGLWNHTVVAPPGTPVIDRSGSGFIAACSYVYPDDDQGCDTPQLIKGVEQLTGQPISSFTGCYRASQFVIREDSKDCPVTPPPPPPPPPPPSGKKWHAEAFTYDRAQSDCAGGERWVAYDDRYRKWVGLELCSSTRYKIYLGEEQHGVFHEIGDFAGHGQDHCELVNPSFTIPNEDDVASGCPGCAVAMAGWERPGEVPVYSRSSFGKPFVLQTWPEHNLYTSRWYECGVAIP